MKIFLSCVSSEFKTYRLKLAHHLGALKNNPFEIKVQEDFQQGGYTLLESIADYIRNCDLVIHIIGEASGAQPSLEHEQTLLQSINENIESYSHGWSYTQWEYYLARKFEKKIFVYIALANATRDCGFPVNQSYESEKLQQRHVQNIANSGEHWVAFDSRQKFVREVFNDLGLGFKDKIYNLPYKSLGTLFKGRKSFIDIIRGRIPEMDYLGYQRSTRTINGVAVAIHGLGGVGKTRTAIEYAHQYSEDYTAIMFIHADTPEGLKLNLSSMCGAMVLNLAEKDSEELEEKFAAVIRWLKQHPGWLLIVDNVDTEQAAESVEQILGQLSYSGQILITTRISHWSNAVECLGLDVLSIEDATEFLLERTENRRRKQENDEDEARKLSLTLGQLALGLEQAGAMIDVMRLSFDKYFDYWYLQRDRILKWYNERLMKYPMSVAVTWQTSFDQVDEYARRLMHWLSWFSSEPIPESILDVPIKLESLSNDEQNYYIITSTDINDALINLEAFSLVTRADNEQTFSVHRLVQDVIRRSLQVDKDHRELKIALQWINEAFIGDPDDVRSWIKLKPLIPHVQACSQFAEEYNIFVPTNSLLNTLGVLLLNFAQYTNAESLFRRVIAIDEFNLDNLQNVNDKNYIEHFFNLPVALSNLGSLLRSTNRLIESEKFLRKALSKGEEVYGNSHALLAKILNNLASLLQDTFRYQEAEPLVRRALIIDEREYGKHHQTVARDMNNLATLLMNINMLDEAESLLCTALAIDEGIYGKDHPFVASKLMNLGSLLLLKDQKMEAEQLFRRALSINEICYGENHPYVADSIESLVNVMVETNRLEDAEPLIRRALAIVEDIYTEQHPRVADHLNLLARVLMNSNRIEESENMLRRSIIIYVNNYGERSPVVAGVLDNLAQLLDSMNRFTEAESIMRTVLEIYEEHFGEFHFLVGMALNNLASIMIHQNKFNFAEPILRRAILITEKVYGENHPNLSIDMHNLVIILMETNRWQEAELLMRRVLSIDEATFYKNHPQVILDLKEMIKILEHTNQMIEANNLLLRIQDDK